MGGKSSREAKIQKEAATRVKKEKPKPKPASISAAAPPLEDADGYIRQDLSVKDFDLLKVVGKGSFGKVMQVRFKKDGKIYAMKVLKKAQLVARKQVAHTQTERRVLQNIDHPFIVSLKFAFQNEDKLYMILDYFTGGELFFHLKTLGRFDEERTRYYAAEIAMAISCLHKKNIVYRDLKPENVLLDSEGHIKLTDFGLSKESVNGDNLTHTFCGTPEYLAPEVIHGYGYGPAVDWWSLGTLIYEMLTGLPPFYNRNLHVMYESIITAKVKYPKYISPDAKSFLKLLLDRDPKRRLGSGPTGADEVLNHPWIAKLDGEALYNKQIPVPFKPSVETKLDTTYVDEEFTSETPKDTPVVVSTLTGKVHFNDFTFTGENNALS